MNKEPNKGFRRARSLVELIIGSSFIWFIIFAPSNAFADSILVLNPVTVNTIGPQSTSFPCIIAGTHCNNPDAFPYTDFKQGGSISTYGEWSPIYNIDDFPFEELKFDVAIDVNTAKNGESLVEFKIYLNPVFDLDDDPDLDDNDGILYSYNGTSASGNIGNVSNNGTGWADWTLGSIDLSQYEGTDNRIGFWANWDTASGGAESFFLYNSETQWNPGSVETPEPTSLLLLGTGLAAFGFCIIRRRRKS